MPRDRLYVALDFRSIKVPAFEVEYIDHKVTAIVDERFGSEWDKEIYCIHPGEGKQELMGRMRWSRGGEKGQEVAVSQAQRASSAGGLGLLDQKACSGLVPTRAGRQA